MIKMFRKNICFTLILGIVASFSNNLITYAAPTNLGIDTITENNVPKADFEVYEEYSFRGYTFKYGFDINLNKTVLRRYNKDNTFKYVVTNGIKLTENGFIGTLSVLDNDNLYIELFDENLSASQVEIDVDDIAELSGAAPIKYTSEPMVEVNEDGFRLVFFVGAIASKDAYVVFIDYDDNLNILNRIYYKMESYYSHTSSYDNFIKRVEDGYILGLEYETFSEYNYKTDWSLMKVDNNLNVVNRYNLGFDKGEYISVSKKHNFYEYQDEYIFTQYFSYRSSNKPCTTILRLDKNFNEIKRVDIVETNSYGDSFSDGFYKMNNGYISLNTGYIYTYDADFNKTDTIYGDYDFKHIMLSNGNFLYMPYNDNRSIDVITKDMERSNIRLDFTYNFDVDLAEKFKVNEMFELDNGNIMLYGEGVGIFIIDDSGNLLLSHHLNLAEKEKLLAYWPSIKNDDINIYLQDSKYDYNATVTRDFLLSFINTENLHKESKDNEIQVDIYAKNSIEMSLSTNTLTFADYNGTKDFESGLDVLVKSSTNYDLNVTLDEAIKEIADNTKIIDNNNLLVKLMSDDEYKIFDTIGKKISLSENNEGGTEKTYPVNLKLLGDGSVEQGTYKTALTFEAIQR